LQLLSRPRGDKQGYTANNKYNGTVPKRLWQYYVERMGFATAINYKTARKGRKKHK
jgi:hypothetical protein